MFLVLDNFFPDSLKNQAENTFLSENMPWEFRHITAGVDSSDPNDKNILETPQFTHLLHCPDRGAVSRYFDIPKSMLFFVEHATGCNITQLSRIKANLLTRDATTKGTYHPPHVDTGGGTYSMVYYVCDSDGPTILFDRKAGLNHHIGLNKIAEIHPRRGRAIIFDSNRYHSSSSPIEHEYRIIFNFVFTAENLKLPKSVDNSIVL
jgi:hypothetical protein